MTRALIYEIDPAAMSATASLEVPLPAEYGSQNRSNACFIDDNLMLFGSSGAKAAIFTDLEGNVKRVIQCDFLPYRAEYIQNLTY